MLQKPSRLRTVQFCKSIQYCCSDVQLTHLAFKTSRHHPLAQSFNAVHFCLYQTSSVVATPIFPYPPIQPFTCRNCCITMCKGFTFTYSGIFSRRGDRSGAALNHCFIYPLGVIKSIASKTLKPATDPANQESLLHR